MRQRNLLVSAVPGFDPQTSHRTFSVVASDYVTSVILAPLVTRMVETAPAVQLEILLPSELVRKQIEDGDIDLLITPDNYSSSDLPAELLFEERHVVVGWSGNPIFSGALPQEQFLQAGHLSVASGNQHVSSVADKALEDAGLTRRIEVIVPSSTTVPILLEGTTRLAIMHERLARAMAARFAISVVPLPFEMPVLREMVQYHFTRAKDKGLIWLRQQFEEIVALQQRL